MLAKRLVPCLDVDRGRVVKGIRFVSLRDAGDPVEAAVRYDACGADELVFLDITASSDARPIVIEMVRRVAEAVYLPFTVGGDAEAKDLYTLFDDTIACPLATSANRSRSTSSSPEVITATRGTLWARTRFAPTDASTPAIPFTAHTPGTRPESPTRRSIRTPRG